MIFKFKALSTEDENFERDYEIKYDSTLHDLHNFICEDLGYDKDEMASFFMSNKNWEKLQEFTLIDMLDSGYDEEGPMSMDSVILGQIIREKHQRLIFTFDLLNDRALFIELIQSHKGDPEEDYPLCSLSQGEAPVQYGEEPEGSIFSTMMDDFDGEFSDSYNDDDYGFDEYSGGGGYEEDYY